MTLSATRLKSNMQRVKTKHVVIILTTAVFVVAVASIAAWIYTQQNSPENQAKSKADSFMRALEARDIDKAVSLAGTSTQSAGYYNQIALQLGSDYNIVKSTNKEDKSRNLYSFIYKAEKPRRPGTTFVRVIVEKIKDELTVNSVFSNATEPSAFPTGT